MRNLSILISGFLFLAACGNRNKDTATTAVETNVPIEAQKPTPRRTISCASVGHITLGMPMSSFREKMITMNYIVEATPADDYGIEGTETGYFVKDGDEDLFFVWSKDQDIVGGIMVLSPLYQTDRGLHIGMDIKEVQKLYPEVMVGKSGRGMLRETFILPTCSPGKAASISLAATDQRPLGHYPEPETGKIPITDLRKEGQVQGITVISN